DIEYYRAGNNDMLLFYEGSTGSAAMYEVTKHGGLGTKAHVISGGWKTTWTDIEYYSTARNAQKGRVPLKRN
ncbi:MAG TPA: hypothetical protein VJ939_00530, partial [Bacteroidales bacterium]|nr:hypothetical protein [Bacteroidales bacterium]